MDVRMWTYEQATGNIYHDGEYIGTGYSGLDDGKNNPDMQEVQGVGPIPPRGQYSIGAAEDNEKLGPHVMPLVPQPQTETFGRSGFFIHGDDIQHPGEGSHGCIVLARQLREQISASGDAALSVGVVRGE